MSNYPLPVKNVAYILYTALVSQADTKLLKSSPTLATGDFKVSIDGGAFANLGTLPTNTPSGVAVKISLSTSEMNGDNILIACIDAAGAEWCDQAINIQTATRGVDDLAFPATSGISMVVDAAGLVDANMVKMGPTGSGTAQTARDIGTSVLLSSGSGAGQLDFTSGVVKANLAQILGTALTETAGLLAAGFKKWFNVSSPTGTLNSIPDAVAGAANGLLIAGSNAATTVNITGNITGNLSGSVGSVTGAVGSMTGNVGGNVNGNVVGSVGSVVAGVTLAVSAVQAIWDALTSALTTVGSIGKLIVDNLDAKISSRLAPTTAGRTLDVAATGEAGLDFDNIKQATGATTLTNIRVPNVTLTDTVTTYTGNTPQTGDAFARLGVAGVGLTNLGDARISNLDATVSSRTKPADTQARVTLVDTVTTYTGNTPQTGDGYAALTGAQAEPGQGAPAVNASPLSKIAYLFKAFRNKKTQTATQFSLFDDSGAVVDQKSAFSDDGTTATAGEIQAGP